jgi:hypothetical protein
MLADTFDRSYGALAEGVIDPGTILVRILEFVTEQLPFWREHPRRRPAQSERVLSDQLCDHLNGAARETLDYIHFRTEVPIQGSRSIDIAAKWRHVDEVVVIDGTEYGHFDTLVPFECKRLPTPTDRDRDEREYVVTRPGLTAGGIQRFKIGAHGSEHLLAGMIGFIQEGDALHWHAQVNRWIAEQASREADWADEQLLSLRDPSQRPTNTWPNADVYCLRSTHRRHSERQSIELFHLWIVLRTEQGPTLPNEVFRGKDAAEHSESTLGAKRRRRRQMAT